MRKLIAALLIVVPLIFGCTPGDANVVGISTKLPIAYIDSISSAGQKYTFNGHGTTPAGTIVAYNWRSDKDGDLSNETQFQTTKLSPGKHTIYFKVQNSKGAWSTEVQKEIEISGSATTGTDTTDVSRTSSTIASSSTTNSSTSSSAKATAKPSFLVTEVTNMSGPPSGTYAPPVTMEFSGSISTDGPGTVTYRWERSDGVFSPTESKIFYGAYHQTVSYSWKVSSSGNYWVRLHTLTPNKVDSISFSVNITCKTALVTDVKATASPASGSWKCPASLKFSYSITTDGPCTVKYVWIRSDGITSSESTTTFSSAGTKTLNYTWKVTESGEYWVQLYTTTPNTMNATYYKTVTVNCQ